MPIYLGAFYITIVCGLLTTVTPVAAQTEAVKATPELQAKVNDLIEDIYQSEVELRIGLRRSKILKMKQDIFRAAVADPSILEFVAFGSREIEIIGKTPGTTTLTLWLGSEQQPRLLSLLVTVDRDESVEDRRRLEYGELQQMLNEMFPNSKIQLIPIANKLIIRGEARDEQESIRIMSIVTDNAQMYNGGQNRRANISHGGAAEPYPDGSELPDSTVISMLRIPGEKQVMLKVRIAELSRSAVRRLGVDFDLQIKDFFLSNALTSTTNALLTGTFNDGSFSLFLDAIAANGTGKILAEPNLVVISGQTATFLSGGQFAVPTVVGVGGAQAATTSFKGYGTQLTFLPTVLDNDRIRLQVNPSFSTLNSDNSVGGIFGVDTREVSTTVELREGQVLAIAGLIQEQQRGDNSRIPFLGELPVLNTVLASKSISRDETELIVVISPELVHPMEPENAPTILPGMEVTEPDDIEFFLYSQIEGRPDCHHRSTVWPRYREDIRRAKKRVPCSQAVYEQSDEYYIEGPHGFSN